MILIIGGPMRVAIGRAEPTLRTDYAYSPSFEHISVKQGLAQSTVHTIVQDKRGFLWFATDLGLSRYDGYRFVTLRRDEEDPNSLQSNIIRTLILDSRGMLWAGTFKGLNRVDPETLAVQAFTYSSPVEGPTQVEAITEAPDGSIWIGGLSGLYRLSLAMQQATKPRFEAYIAGTPGTDGLYPGGIESLHCDPTNTLWIGSRHGLYRAVPASERTGRRFEAFTASAQPAETILPDNCRALVEGDSGSLWAGCFNGLFELNASRNQVRRYLHDPQDATSLASNIVMAIYRDRAGGLWVGNDGAGLARMLPRRPQDAPRFVRMQHDPANSRSLSGDGVQNIFEDRSGVLWVSAFQAGLNKLVLSPIQSVARERPSLRQYRNIATDPSTLSGDTVSAIGEDRFGNLWVGTDGYGINRVLTPASKDEPLRFQRYRATASGSPNGLLDDVALSFHLDSRKRFWMGTYTHGLVRIDQESASAEPHFTYFRNDPTNSDSIGDDFVRCVLDDGRGRLWLCTNKSALNLFDPDTGVAKRLTLGKDGHPGMWSANEILDVVADGYHTLWIASSEGLVRYNPETGEARGYVPGGPGSIGSASVLTLHVGASEVLWLGTNGGGLNKTLVPPWNGPAPSFVRFTTKNGLPSDVVKNILEDSSGQLWLTTDRSLCRFVPQENKGYAFPYQRDLSEAEFISNSGFRSPAGELFFGSNDGFSVFHPKNVRYNSIAPVVAVTGFQVMNKPTLLKSRMVGSGRDDQNATLTLRPADTAISFEFSAMHFVAPERNRYFYMMEGLDPTWIDAGFDHSVSFTTLPPGNYVWRVRATNCDGIPSKDDLALHVRVLPPWYHAWWFRGLLMIAAAGVVYVVIRLRLSVLKARNLQLEAMVVQRTRELGEATRALKELALIDGRFRALFKLGEGGMAEVLLAAAVGAGGYRKLVVLKCLRMQMAADAEMCEAFVFEARLMASMSHQNVVQIIELIDVDSVPIIVMEYLEGRTLAQLVASTAARLSLAMHLHILCEVLEALDYVHTLKDLRGTPLELVHRDISPDNIMVTYDGHVKLLDFGIAKSSALRRKNTTSTGILKGKLHYMAPEQLAGDKVDCRTDLFAVGIMLWEALAGRRIWAEMSESIQMRALINGEFPALREAQANLPETLYSLVERVLNLDIDARIPTARAFRDALNEGIAELCAVTDASALQQFMVTSFAAEREETRQRVLRRVEADPRTWSEAPPAMTTGQRRKLWQVQD
jgi:ligand-binding sensor domain-containing protein/tRNA A-37 threonylcarbamoyl transferase component Bud32